MGWNVANYIAGAICVIGPLFLIVWYFRAAKEQVRKLQEKSKGQG